MRDDPRYTAKKRRQYAPQIAEAYAPQMAEACAPTAGIPLNYMPIESYLIYYNANSAISKELIGYPFHKFNL